MIPHLIADTENCTAKCTQLHTFQFLDIIIEKYFLKKSLFFFFIYMTEVSQAWLYKSQSFMLCWTYNV